MAISVAVPVTDKVADALSDKLTPKIATLQVGPAADSDFDMGPLVAEQHRDKVHGYIDAVENEGAKILVGGRGLQINNQGYENGYFVRPTLIDGVTPDMPIWKEEIFGPVLSVVRRQNHDEAVNLIHAHEYANGVAIFTRDGDAARRFAQDIEVGMVGVNVPIPVPMAFHSFGGCKACLFGDHHMHGPKGVRFYTRLKTVTTRWPSSGVRTDLGGSTWAAPPTRPDLRGPTYAARPGRPDLRSSASLILGLGTNAAS